MYSILITSYECYGKGKDFLRENLESVFSQTYRPLQCIVSDHSRDDEIQTMVRSLDPGDIDFVYVRYNEHYGNPVQNWKNALAYATGDYLHYFAMDDKLAHPNAILDIVNFFEKTPEAKWVACQHRVHPNGSLFIPRWNDRILEANTISGPSAVVVRSELRHIEMDPTFLWYLDLDWYYRIWKDAGPPAILDSVAFIGRLHENQLTNKVCNIDFIHREDKLMREKYGDPLPRS